MSESNKNTSEATKISAEEIAFPKGGGAVKGLGDSFRTNLFSGAGTCSIPVPVTPARGFEPKLDIVYSSGAGNGIFGLGFSLSLSKVSVRTNKRIPKYDGTDEYELDGDVLVVRENSATAPNPRNDVYEGHTCRVTNYLSGIESSFSQIEHWQNEAAGLSFWKVITADNTTNYYGIRSQIANPDDAGQVFEWLVDQSADNKGNRIAYNYVAENAVNVPDHIYELNRSHTANRYIHTIQYGNYYDASGKMNFAFELVFNYAHNQQDGWSYRPDPFSFYNSGFEIRTCRLCRSIQLVHVFPEELGEAVVVKEMVFTYENIQQYTPVRFQGLSVLAKVSLQGFRKELSEPQALPFLEFGYSAFQPPASPGFKMLAMGEAAVPAYPDATHFLPVDLNGEGLPGFLLGNKFMSLYLEPLGDGEYKLPVANTSFPIHKNIQENESVLKDLDGNGQLELVVNTPAASGFYERTPEGGWNNFVPFERYPNFISNPEMEFADLSANGRSDLLLAETNGLRRFLSQGKKGYSPAHYISGENDFPLIKQDFSRELVTFANMFGDGLSHRVKISRGLVECWPCLGYGQFGKKVALANAPVFDERFDAKRLFLTDVDGSGTTDLAYVYADRVELFLNQSGNSFSDAVVVRLPELFGAADRIHFTDILGNGTACIVFTKMAPVPKHYYYNFSGESKLPDGSMKQSLKPYLLNRIDNNMGAVSYVNYCSSTKFILEDKRNGTPWLTKLPFPVQVVEEVIRYELLSASRYVTRYKYHDGYYDGEQRQFKGFGFVESWDTETYEEFQVAGSNPDYPASELNKELFVPPVYTKTWCLNGAPAREYEKLSAKYKSDYFSKDTGAYDFPDSLFPPEVHTGGEKTFVEAHRALASNILRTEVYALDGTPASVNPYSVAESNYSVVLIQPATEGRHAVFQVNPRESITYHYERNEKDPRVEQHFVLQTDLLCGQPLQSCTVYLPRRNGQAESCPEQQSLKAVVTAARYYNSPASDFNIRLRGVKYEEQQFNLLGAASPSSGYFSFEGIRLCVQTALENVIPYMAEPSAPLQAQQFGLVRSFFCDPAAGLLPLGQVPPQVLLHHVSIAEFTNETITAMFGQRLTRDAIRKLGGYVYDPESGYWENQGLVRHYYPAQGFYLPSGTSSQLGTMSAVAYDTYYLTTVSTTSYISVSPPVANVVHVTTDYQTMAPKQLVDINGNVSQALFDALGRVVVTSLFGTENGVPAGGVLLYPYDGKESGYELRTSSPDGGAVDFDSVIKDDAAKEYYLQGACGYFYYGTDAFAKRKQPVSSICLQRCNYAGNPEGEADFSCQTVISYCDGLSRLLVSKTEAEPDGCAVRWLASGRSVYNNKGGVCESYLPYFSDTPFYQTQDEISVLYQVPPPTITRYDPLLRTVRIDTPKGFFSKVEFTPWEQVSYDEDDTAADSVYYRNFMARYPPQPAQEQIEEKKALEMAAGFYGTPVTRILDNMGQAVRRIELLKDQHTASRLVTFYALDIQGRTLVETDPRLYAGYVNAGAESCNFRYRYAMRDDSPWVADSADGGVQKCFSNIFGKQVWSLSPRDYCQVVYYDGLQRLTHLLVKKIPGTEPVADFDSFNLVELFTYGEDAAAPADGNLRGQIYMQKDLSGVQTNEAYSMPGSVLKTVRQMAAAYKTAVNWHNDVPLETGSCTKVYSYNALNLLLGETIADDGITWNTTTNTYNREGLLYSVFLTANGVKTTVIENITYDANGQRTRIVYGNGVAAAYGYEASTLRLIRIFSRRGSSSSGRVVQDMAYTYDPAGNITCTRDSSIDTVFNNNQKVDPVCRYRYDSLYRLIQAMGRQHPGISSNGCKRNTREGNVMLSGYRQQPVNDAQAIENYTENYVYDDAGNLIKKQHIAASSSWTVGMPVLENCNRMQGVGYDASGNQRQLAADHAVSLGYNCCENLVTASVIERPDGTRDADYYVYASSEQRTRKVCEQYANDTSVKYSDTIYYGNYEVLRKGFQAAGGTRTVAANRRTLRIMDGSVCVAILYHWIEGGPDSSGTGNPAPDRLRYQMGNHLDSVAVELDEQGLLASYEEYFPYGGTSFIAGPDQVDVALKTYRYSGKECDNSTGLYYYGRRYYVSWLGRWLNADPAGTADGLNLFAFVGGNPVSYADVGGMMKRPAPRKKTQWIIMPSDGAIMAFRETPGIWGRGKKHSIIGADEHFKLGEESFSKGEKLSATNPGYLFRVKDKGSIPSPKKHTTPGNPWTPQRSVAWVKGGIASGAEFILTTDPTREESFLQSRGEHSGESSIYAREVSELLANDYIPVFERRSEVLKKSAGAAADDYLVRMIPGRPGQKVSKTDWSRVSGTEIPSFDGDAFVPSGPHVSAEDLADTFQEYIDIFSEDFDFKMYGSQWGPPA